MHASRDELKKNEQLATNENKKVFTPSNASRCFVFALRQFNHESLVLGVSGGGNFSKLPQFFLIV
jgi:hypothetical protein